MDINEIETSSDDDDDLYSNPVAKLNALRNRAKTKQNIESKQDKIEEKLEDNTNNIIIIPDEVNDPVPEDLENIRVTRSRAVRGHTNRGRRGRGGPRRSTRRRGRQANGNDSDLEIVSVEDPTPQNALDDTWIEMISKDDKPVTVDVDELKDDDMCIKIYWRSKDIHRINMRRNDDFMKVFQYFADLEGVPISDILLSKLDRKIKKTDTPASIELTVIDILEGGVLKEASGTAAEPEENKCIIKVQITNKKNITVPVGKDENLKIVFEKCIEELGVEKSKIKLHFDGELVNETDTPSSLDIEDEACFDLHSVS